MLEPRKINSDLKGAPPGPFLPLRIRLLEALPLRLSASFLPQARPSLLDRECFPKRPFHEICGAAVLYRTLRVICGSHAQCIRLAFRGVDLIGKRLTVLIEAACQFLHDPAPGTPC
jgi:hypothetical protein